MLKKNTVACITLTSLLFMTHSALALELDYKHKYEDLTKEHTDVLTLSHTFRSGIGIGAKMKFHPEEKDNGDSGNFTDRRKLAEKEVKLNYTYKLTENTGIEPAMVYEIKDHEKKYKPSLKLKYHLSDNTRLSFRYRKEIADEENKPIKRVDRIDSEISQKIDNFKLSYTFTWYHGNENLYNNKKQDTEQEVKAGYQLTHHWLPYIGVKNVSLSKSSSQRQTEFITGISYEF